MEGWKWSSRDIVTKNSGEKDGMEQGSVSWEGRALFGYLCRLPEFQLRHCWWSRYAYLSRAILKRLSAADCCHHCGSQSTISPIRPPFPDRPLTRCQRVTFHQQCQVSAVRRDSIIPLFVEHCWPLSAAFSTWLLFHYICCAKFICILQDRAYSKPLSVPEGGGVRNSIPIESLDF